VDEYTSLATAELESVRALIENCSHVWTEFGSRVPALRTSIADLEERALAVGDHGPDIAQAVVTFEDLVSRVASDPLSVTNAEMEALDHEVETISTRIDSTLAFARELEAELEAARGLLGELAVAAAEADRARRELGLKIAGVANSQPSPARSGEDCVLDRVARLAEAGEWREARESLERWTAGVRANIDEARSFRDICRAPVVERNRLRGLLDAYRAKAFAVGLGENRDLADRHDRAHAELFRAPTDLERAAAYVYRYRRALAERVKEEAVR